ncbi:MAG: threonine synthase, partial [Saprospiraceae bacterium]|nr:threonine synthase [Saprospiraceae bacterium]
HVLQQFVHGVIDDDELRSLVAEAINFPFPIVRLEDQVFTLELFHGPTLAFKDVGARCMGRILPYCIDRSRETVVLVATSGDTGAAVAHGFLGVDGVKVVVLYPKGKVSALQERQMATLGKNVLALAIDGVFDDCQALVKQAFVDEQLAKTMQITSANSINLARWLPQAIYFICALRDLRQFTSVPPAVCVPSGNYGNLTAGLVAERLGLPVRRWVAASNANDVVPAYLATGNYTPRPSVQTLSNAMDVGAPSNFDRMLALFANDGAQLRRRISGECVTDAETLDAIRSVFDESGYLLDPHGATGYVALRRQLKSDEMGVFLETAHPAKFPAALQQIGLEAEIPERLTKFTDADLLSIPMPNDYDQFRSFLLEAVL